MGQSGLCGMWEFICLFARFARYALPYWDKLILMVLLAQCTGMMWVLSAMATAKAVDEGLRAQDTAAFMRWALFWFGIQVLLYIIYNLHTIFTAFVRMRVDQALKLGIYDHFQRLSLRFQQSRPIGENMFRINNDTTVAAGVSASALPDIVTRLVNIATTSTMLFALDMRIAGFIVIYFAAYWTYAHIVTTYSTHFQAEVRESGQAAQAMLQENLSAYVVSKAMSRERHESHRYFGRLARLARSTFKYGATYGFCMESLRWMGNWVNVLLVTLFCGSLVLSGNLTIGEFAAVGSILQFVIGPLQILVWTLIWFRVSAVTLRRMLETLDQKPEIAPGPYAHALAQPQGEIVFEDVVFRYTSNGPDVIKGLNLRVPPGKKLAIVGSSGAGKTSIFNLLMRYYDPVQGRVLIDGKDLKEIDPQSYHENVSIVLQDNFMYSATIRDNILFGKLGATEQELERAVDLAGLGPMLASLPRGIDTVLREGGDLSAGQLQRIGMARAVLRDPRFLFLDEATSSLDPVTEAEILAQLRKIEAGRTRLVIAHNIVSVRDADEILVMKEGEVVQSGVHDELARQEGIYREMWNAELEKLGDGAGTP